MSNKFLMHFLYNIGIYLYTLGVRIASLFNHKARAMVGGWRESRQKLLDFAHSAGSQPVAWFHVASLGEFEQARPVLEQFREEHPSYRLLLTFFSPSGYEVRHAYDKADCVAYLPMDTPANARRLVQTVAPRVAFFVKYDFWFNYLLSLRHAGTTTYIFSAIFRPSHYFFRPYGKWFLHQLREGYSHIFVQNDESLTLLRSHGIDHCSLAGDTRFDRVYDIAAAAQRFPEIERFVGDAEQVLMAGSSWQPDEQNLRQYFDHAPSTLKFILAPHVISAAHIEQIENLFGTDHCVRYSQLSTAGDVLPTRRVLIVDNMGMLSALYRYATVAYIGGGFGRGIHNTLEAVAFAHPVVFGPNYQKFQEAHDLIACKGGFAYTHYSELETILDNLLNNPNHLQKSSAAAANYMKNNVGSTKTILQIVNQPFR